MKVFTGVSVQWLAPFSKTEKTITSASLLRASKDGVGKNSD